MKLPNPLVHLLLSQTVLAIHAHHPLQHKHGRRQAAVTASVAASAHLSAPVVAENALVQDMTQIEQGISGLPADVLSFISAVQSQLQQAESILASLLGQGTSPTVSISSTFPVATRVSSTLSTLPSLPTPAAYTYSAPSMASTSISLCHQGGAGPLVPCTDLTSPATDEAYSPIWTSPRHVSIP